MVGCDYLNYCTVFFSALRTCPIADHAFTLLFAENMTLKLEKRLTLSTISKEGITEDIKELAGESAMDLFLFFLIPSLSFF